MINAANTALIELSTHLGRALKPLDDGLGGTPDAPAGFTAQQIGPGFAGFVLTFGIAICIVFLVRDMVKRMRGVKLRGESMEQAALAGASQSGGIAFAVANDAPEEKAPATEDTKIADAPRDPQRDVKREKPIANHLKRD